jgi:hypothetical protein
VSVDSALGGSASDVQFAKCDVTLEVVVDPSADLTRADSSRMVVMVNGLREAHVFPDGHGVFTPSTAVTW